MRLDKAKRWKGCCYSMATALKRLLGLKVDGAPEQCRQSLLTHGCVGLDLLVGCCSRSYIVNTFDQSKFLSAPPPGHFWMEINSRELAHTLPASWPSRCRRGPNGTSRCFPRP